MLRFAAKPRNLVTDTMPRRPGRKPLREPTMQPAPSSGLRHFSRILFDAEVLLHLSDRTINVQLIDIALKGALVKTATSEPLVLEEKCRLEMPLTDGGDGVMMAGRIVHLEGRHVGIECQDIDVTSLTRLRRLIELNVGDADLMKRELLHLFGKR